METLKEAPEYQISAVFKSYYVVWKLSEHTLTHNQKYGLNRTM